MPRTPKRYQTHVSIRRIVFYSLAGGFIGFINAYFADYQTAGCFALTVFFVLLPALHLVIIYRGLYIPILLGMRSSYIAILCSLMIFEVVYALVLEHLRDGRYDSSVFLAHTALAFIVHVPITATLIVWNLLDESRIRSTNCLGCGYPLKGLIKKQCPECGRPFTLEELGVSQEELDV